MSDNTNNNTNMSEISRDNLLSLFVALSDKIKTLSDANRPKYLIIISSITIPADLINLDKALVLHFDTTQNFPIVETIIDGLKKVIHLNNMIISVNEQFPKDNSDKNSSIFFQYLQVFADNNNIKLKSN
jgi:hypothetical protein